MKAIILAAGVGSRLSPITDQKPKTLVKVNNKAMIDYIVDALIFADIKTIVVCVGYRGHQLKQHLTDKYSQLVELVFVDNQIYDSTNNMYSLYLAKAHLQGDVLLMNADLVIDKEIISELVRIEGSAVAVDKGNYLEEAMKVVVVDGIIKNISKKIAEGDAYGSSIDIYKFSAEATDVLRGYISKIIEDEKDLNQWTEVLLDRVFQQMLVIARPFDIGSRKWYEIDNLQDLSKAEILFNEKLLALKHKTTFILDKDGTISIGSKPLAGALKFMEALNLCEKRWLIASNNSSRPSSAHAKSIDGIFGKPLHPEFISSLDFAIHELRRKNVRSLYWVANDSVSAYLSEFFIQDALTPDAILLTYDTQIDYDKITTAVKLINAGAAYYATHIDMVCPVEGGTIPDIGSFIEMIGHCTGVTPLQTFGKPNKEFIDFILEATNAQPEQAVLIGDRLYTDIKSCFGTEITSVLVLSGETTRCEYEFSEYRADIVVPSIDCLTDYLK
jgi:HAD superfamily hydrolase (TIGR01450 family)